MIIEIHGTQVQKEYDFHVQFNKYAQWRSYGHNLSALYDVLTSLDSRPIELIWHDSQVSRKFLGVRFDKIVYVFDLAVAFDEAILNKHKPGLIFEPYRFSYKLQ